MQHSDGGLTAVTQDTRQLYLLNGLHRGASAALPDAGSLVIGSRADCDVILCDKGVAESHCQVRVDEYGVSCRALGGSITIDGQALKPGAIATLGERQIVQCGTAAFAIGSAAEDWSALERSIATRDRSTVRSLRNVNPYVLFASVATGLIGVLSLTYAALSPSESGVTTSRVDAARVWLTKLAPSGSELHIGIDQRDGQKLLLSGYVANDDHRIRIASQAAASQYAPRVEVFAIDSMLASMSRLADLARIACEPQYRGEGHVSCARVAPSEADAARLRLFAKDVPGLRSLDVDVAPAPQVSAPAPAVAATPPLQITQRFAVLMHRQQRYLINEYGKRFREGDEFDGFRIRRIELDRVVFARDGRDFEFYVAALGKKS